MLDRLGMHGTANAPGVARERLLKVFLETGSFKYSETPSYPLASGVLSHYYIDCKVALSYPEPRRLVGGLILEQMTASEVDAVGGLLIGAYPIAIAVSDAAERIWETTVRAFVVRKEPKKHGLRKLIEGEVRAGDRVVIVDDVITSGGSTVEAIKKSRDAGLKVVKVIALIDRQEQGGRETIEAESVPFMSLYTLEDFRRAHGVTE